MIRVLKTILTVITITAFLLPIPLGAETGSARVFYYGNYDSIYLGRRHAASWWEQTPEGWPEVVDLVHYGVATSDHTIPFGTKLCLEVTSFPAWSKEEYSDLIGTTICNAVVVDRMPVWVEYYFGQSIDIWPALARELIGSDFERVGTIRVRITPEEQLHGRELLLRSRR